MSYKHVPSESAEYFWMMHCLMYGYIPLEFREGLTADATQAEGAPDVSQATEANRAKINLAWQALMLGLLLSLIGLISCESASRVPAALSLQTQGVVSEVGMPLRWKF